MGRVNVMCSRPKTQWDITIVAPRRHRDVVEEELDSEVLLFDPRTGQSYQLNETAASVWRSCDGRTSIERIAQEQTKKYEVDFETVLDHVEQLVAKFAESHLVDQETAA